MGTTQGRLKNYAISRFSGPRNWNAPRVRHYSAENEQLSCPHQLILVPPERSAERPTLPELLSALRSEEFTERLTGLPEGRELDFFAADPLVTRLVSALRTPEAGAVLEEELDDLFTVYRQGQVFEHTEITMALLYAIKAANVPDHEQILAAFAAAKPAEFWALKRFASALLRR